MAENKVWPTGIRPCGAGFRVRIKAYGKEHSETVRGTTKSALTRAVQRRKWLENRVAAGLPIKDDGPSHIQLFKEVAEDYLDTLDARDSTVREYYRILNNWWMDLGNCPIQEITAAQIKRVLSGMGVSSKTKKNRLIPLYGVFKHAELSHPKIKLKRSQRSEVSRYTPKERKTLLSRLEGQSKVYFSLLFATGLRPGEALALEWSDYNQDSLVVGKSISKRKLVEIKTAVRRTVYVPTWVRPILNGHSTRFAGCHIFTNSQGGVCLDTDVFNREWRKAHSKARIPYRIPYTCRHTRAAELLSVGVQPAVAAKQLGHSIEMFLRIYSEFIEEYSNQDMSLLEGIGGKIIHSSGN